MCEANKTVIITDSRYTKRAIQALKKAEIPFDLPGFPNGKVSVEIEFESKINTK
ncbi:hypothetical protein [Galbibacter sp. BG1]